LPAIVFEGRSVAVVLSGRGIIAHIVAEKLGACGNDGVAVTSVMSVAPFAVPPLGAPRRLVYFEHFADFRNDAVLNVLRTFRAHTLQDARSRFLAS